MITQLKLQIMFIYNLNHRWSDAKSEVEEIKLKFSCEYMGNEF